MIGVSAGCNFQRSLATNLQVIGVVLMGERRWCLHRNGDGCRLRVNLSGTVALVDVLLGQVGLMRRRLARVPAP